MKSDQVKKNVELIIVDDHKLFRDGLKHILNCLGNISVVAEASNGCDFIKLLDTYEPDLVLIDICMPCMDGIEATEAALAKYPDLKIIALSMYSNEEYYNKMIKAGVKGFILKESGSHELEDAIREVLDGNTYFSQELLRMIIKNNGQITSNKAASGIGNFFTNREMEVLKYICQGMNNYEIARILFVSQRTIEGHRARLLKKTATKNTVNLIMFSIKNKLIEI